MSNRRPTFMELVVSGGAFLDDVDDFIDAWTREHTTESLAEYLGMTQEEYGLWVEQAASLRFIVEARRRGGDLPPYDAIAQAARDPVAMRAANAREAKVVLEWLEETGRIKRRNRNGA
jgi:hypothetical protein